MHKLKRVSNFRKFVVVAAVALAFNAGGSYVARKIDDEERDGNTPGWS